MPSITYLLQRDKHDPESTISLEVEFACNPPDPSVGIFGYDCWHTKVQTKEGDKWVDFPLSQLEAQELDEWLDENYEGNN